MQLPPLFIRGKLSEVNLILSVVSYNRQRSHRHLQPALHPAELATGGKWTYNRQCEHDFSRVHTAGCKSTYHRWQVLSGGAPVVSGGENAAGCKLPPTKLDLPPTIYL